MKKYFVAVALLFAGIVGAHADGKERPITVDQLPKPAQEFVNTYFKDLTVAYAVAERDSFKEEYEVVFTDRTEVDFRQDGQWKSVERKYSALPEAIVPQQIRDYLTAQHYDNLEVRKIESKAYGWEVELSNGMEIEFDRIFKVVDIDF